MQWSTDFGFVALLVCCAVVGAFFTPAVISRASSRVFPEWPKSHSVLRRPKVKAVVLLAGPILVTLCIATWELGELILTHSWFKTEAVLASVAQVVVLFLGTSIGGWAAFELGSRVFRSKDEK